MTPQLLALFFEILVLFIFRRLATSRLFLLVIKTSCQTSETPWSVQTVAAQIVDFVVLGPDWAPGSEEPVGFAFATKGPSLGRILQIFPEGGIQ